MTLDVPRQAAGRPPRAALPPRPWLERIEPYRPALRAASDDGSLASNESPLGASARVVTAITGAALQAHRYPDPLAGALRTELAALHGVHPDQILVGNGSDELIFLLAWPTSPSRGTRYAQPTRTASTSPSHDFGYVRIRSLVLPSNDNSYSA